MCFWSWSWISKELHELHNDYPLAPDKIEIKRKMLPEYKLIADLYNVSIGNFKKLVPNLFDKEKSMYFIETKYKIISHIRIQSVTMVKAICWIQHTNK